MAIPADGWKFDSWSDGVTDSLRYIDVTSDTALTARFVQLDGIEQGEAAAAVVRAAEGAVVVEGAEHQTVRVFDAVGRLVSRTVAASDSERIQLSATGVYLVQVGNAPAKRVVVMR